MVKNIFILLVIVFLLSSCSDDKNKTTLIVDPLASYTGRVACPRCKKSLDRTIIEQKSQIVSCPKCKIKAPRHIFCRDLKKLKKK
jgi:hypothetical protein